MLEKLPRSFYTRPTLAVAKDLLGKFVVRKWRGKKIVGKIVETEAYIGPRDKAAHSYNWRRTKRNEAEYLVGGHIYIYLIYGMYWQFNISTSFEGRPECVLIRALEPVDASFPQTRGGLRRDADDIKQHLLFNFPPQLRREELGVLSKPKLKVIPNGPGKLCQYLKIDKSFYGEDLVKSKKIWLMDGGHKIKKSGIISAKRIGIDYAQEWARKPWRFYLKDNPFVSKR